MNNERPFENIIPVPNIKVGYFEKEEYLKIIDRQEKQIESSAYQIMALQSRIEILEKNQRPQGEWKIGGRTTHYHYCSICGKDGDLQDNFCRNCGADMRGAELYREETCKNKDSCDDYKYWHCVGCNGCKKGGMK